MTARPVIAPDGTIYPAGTRAAAHAKGITTEAIRKAIARGTSGWRYADEGDTVIAKCLEVIQGAGKHGATMAEVDAAIGRRERSYKTVSSAISSLCTRGLVERAGQARRLGRPASTVYVAVAEPMPLPLREPTTQVGNIRHSRFAMQRPALIERDVAVAAEGDVAPELLRYRDMLMSRFQPVVPLKCGRWLVERFTLPAEDMVALAKGEVRLRELVG
jgi:hypothetical protein